MAQIIVGGGVEEDRDSIRLATREDNWIRNERRLEAAPDRMRAAVDYARRNCPDARPRSASATYNCVGMVFASRRVWVDPEELPQIFRDDGFREIRRRDVVPGDVVVYEQNGDDVHIGVVVRVEVHIEDAEFEIEVLSQWGGDGEYFHPEGHVPSQLGRVGRYLTERRQV